MTRLLGWRSLRMLLGLLALIEAIFIAESFTSLMESVVRNGGSALDLALLLTLKTPEVIDFALPLVILLGLFFAINGARDDNELVVCAAAGVPWTRIPLFAFNIGLAGFCFSILFAGYLTPMANYAQRMAIYALETHRTLQEIVDPAPKNSLRGLQDRTVIATPPTDPTAERGNLFVFEPDKGDGWRVSQADDWTVVVPEADEGYSIRLQGFRDYTGVSRPDGGVETNSEAHEDLQARFSTARLKVKSLAMEFRLEQVIAAADRARRNNERLLFSAPSGGAADDAPALTIDRRVGEVIARALLCPIAALLAVAAAAWSATPQGRFLALPVAAIAVLAGDIFARTLLGDAAQAGTQVFLSGAFLVLAVGLGSPLIYIIRRGEVMIASSRGRS